MLARRQHGDDTFRSACRIGGIGRSLGAIGGDGGNSCGHQVKNRDLMPGLQQVAHHMRAHIAKTNKADACHGSLPFLQIQRVWGLSESRLALSPERRAASRARISWGQCATRRLVRSMLR